MFGVREINKKDNGFPTLYENVSDNIRFNKISNYKSNTGNSYCEANNSKMLAKISSNETCEEQQQNDYNSSNSDDNNDYENLWHRNNSNLKKVTELNSPCKLAVSSPDDRKSNFTTTSNSSYHTNCKLERSRSDSPVQFTVMVQQQLQKKESHLNLNNSDNHQTDDENNENFLSDDDDDNDEDDGDDDSTDSEFSDLSGLSDISGQDWKPMAKPINWVQKQIHLGADPREILSQILSNGTMIAPDLNDMTLWRILANILSEPPRRPKLKNINTINDVVKLLKTSKNIIVLTGAGVSVSCGIPDFRSNNGIYNRLAKDFPDLPDPQAMFDINYFSKDPRPFYKFAREIYPGQFTPSPCHRFIKLLEKKHKLLRNYTQNIDTLEQVAGIKNVIECHGSFATASCTKCKYKTTADAIRDDIFAQRIPICPKCQKSNNQSETAIMANDNNYEFGQINKTPSYSEIVQNGIMKPDIVFFGEGLPDAFHTAMASDKDHCDLLIVIGSSLKVRPVALIPSSIPPNVPQILINREQLNHLEFDVELLGDSDVIINHLCHLLGNDWEEICWNSTVLHETKHLKPKSNNTDVSLSSSIIDDDIKSHTISDFSSSSKSDNLIIDGSNSPFCDSGFDSSSSHPVYNISLSKDNQQQLQHQHQQHQYYQHQNQQSQQLIKGNFHQNSSIPQQSSSSFPCLVSSSSSLSSFESSSMNNDENEKNILFDLKTKQKSNSNNANIQDDQANNEKLFLSSKSSRNKSIDSLKDGNDTCDTLNNKPVSLTLSGTNILNNSNNCNDNFYHNYRNHSDNNCSNSPLHHNNDKNNFIDNKNSNQHFYNDNNDDGGNPNIGTTEHHHVWSSNNKQQTSSSIPSSNSLFVTSATSSSSSASSIINVKSIAERLLENSYYCHSKKCAYVFPGAQIFWNSDSEDDNDEDDDDGSDDCEDNDNDDDEKEGVAIDNNCENSRDNDVECNDKVENHCIDSDDTITSSSSDDDDNYDNDNKLSKTPNLIYNNVEKISENKSNHNSNNYDINNENIDNDDVPPNKRRRE